MKFPAHKGGLFLTHNEHRNVYESAEEWINRTDIAWHSAEAKQQAIATDEIWTLQWYPNTPVGFHHIAAPTLEDLLAFAATYEAV